eukprot:TRINITY_DN49742_c0_g1_i1.p1 TRINITY_DN49742_c0_g1~~TRINITY_DN49742_c0_g1_i1.p1  ORF type:complete len:231 (-),score=49.12 TRINITY_DN49742_c0_g1_i1:76-741(-)
MPPPDASELDEEAAVEAAIAAEAASTVKLPQSEAIMEAIIRSSKPLNIGPDDSSGALFKRWNLALQQVSDALVPYFWCRWLSFGTLVLLFAARVASIERHFFAAYALAIYVLNQVLLFLSPATEDDGLPASTQCGEYRPFVRALSEFRLWCRGALATVVALVATYVDDLDIDVDGAALLFYFALLFLYTMKQQISHMIKYRYVPWNRPKKKAYSKDPAMDL